MKRVAVPLLIALIYGFGCLDAHATSANPVRHVLLISIDGLHQNDLVWFVKHHPDSALAGLARKGIEYTQALTPFPSDSFPGLVGQITGGNPKTTGIYYDEAFSRELLPPGTTTCEGAKPGTAVQYAENIDRDPQRLDAGQNIAGLYDNAPDSFALISQLSSAPAKDLIDPARLPVDPRSCQPVYPHQYLQVNTVFDVVHAKGLRSAWSDKHPAYDILNGRSGSGVDEFFTPEINSASINPNLGPDLVADNLNTQLYDGLKVTAVLNWLKGQDHAGSQTSGVPAILGMSFQSVSAAQKFTMARYRDPTAPSVILQGPGGYSVDAGGQLTPGPVLVDALTFVDASIGKLVQQVNAQDTIVIISAKHGQSPENRDDLTVINDDAMIEALNTAWRTKTGSAQNLVAHAMDDDSVLLWLTEHSQQAADFAAHFLMLYHGNGMGIDPSGREISKPFRHAGLKRIYAGEKAASFIGVSYTDPRVPDVIGLATHGSVYGGRKLYKLAEHGGNTREDRHVALIIAGAGIHHKLIHGRVETTQIAPTILKLLHLDPNELQAVRMEGTRILPGV